MKISFFTPLLFLALIINAGCGGNSESPESIEDALEVEIDTTASTIVSFSNTLFSIPSPYQIAFLVKNMDVPFNKEFLNPTNRSSNYTNNYKKALNLGVYGADLGYLNIYEQTPDAISYFSAIKSLSDELDILSSFTEEMVDRVENNMSNKDSLLYIISNTYRSADTYLKENNREDIGVLILAGGWIESLNFMCSIAAENPTHSEIVTRIGEQKHPLDNLIKILSPYYNKTDEYTGLIDGLIDLAYEFDGIETKYTYEEPDIDVENKLTVINSKSEIIFSPDQLKTIAKKVSGIRAKIIE